MMTLALILGGFVCLLLGGESLVRGAVSLARRFGISELIIGLTLIGFGTSLPELVTSLQALSQGAVGLSVGNVIGSNVANIMLVLGAAALFTPIVASATTLRRDGLIMAAVTLSLIALLWFDGFSRTMGALLTGILVLYLIGSVWLDRRGNTAAGSLHEAEADLFEETDPVYLAILLTVGGILGVIFGARFLVEGGTTAARLLGVSETVIGISVLAIGTSLPELMTSLIAARRGKADVALGNVLGSNIFNILGILGITAMVYPFSIHLDEMSTTISQSVVSWIDIAAMGLSVGLLFLFAASGRRIGRSEGAILLAAYAAYIALRFNLLAPLGVTL